MSTTRRAQVTRMTKHALAAAMVLLLSQGCVGLFSSGPQRQVRAAPHPVVYATVAPTIDGRLDDPVWRDAMRLEPLYEYNKVGVLVDLADIRLAWDPQFLYVAYDIRDQDLYVTERERDAVLCRADVAELFVKPPVRDRYEYELYEFEFNLWEAIWDIHFAGYGGDGSQGAFLRALQPRDPRQGRRQRHDQRLARRRRGLLPRGRHPLERLRAQRSHRRPRR